MIPLETDAQFTFTAVGAAPSTAERRGAHYVNRYVAYEQARGMTMAGNRITIAGQPGALATGLWDDEALELYEAKGTATRYATCLPIGELFDHRRNLTPPPNRCTVLLPSDPGVDLVDLITSVGFELVYQDGATFFRRA